jgi:hypothetical protein
MVSDTDKHLEFPLSGTFTASTGAGVVTITPDLYAATFGAGGAVSIAAGGTTFVSGSPMFADSHLGSELPEDVGSFRGEFSVTSVDPGTLALFGLGPKWEPDGSVSLTFAQAHVSGEALTAVIGGGTVTIETPSVAVIPEPSVLALTGTALLIGLIYQRRRYSRAQRQ